MTYDIRDFNGLENSTSNLATANQNIAKEKIDFLVPQTVALNRLNNKEVKICA